MSYFQNLLYLTTSNLTSILSIYHFKELIRLAFCILLCYSMHIINISGKLYLSLDFIIVFLCSLNGGIKCIQSITNFSVHI